MKLFLIRHGTAKIADKEAILTKKGVIQANSVAKELSKYQFSAIYTSDLIRAEDTAKRYITLTKEEIIKTKKLREIYRVLVGGPIKKDSSKDRKKNDKKRSDEIFKELLKKEGNVLVFCHGNIIRYFLNKIMKSKENIWENIQIDNGSITIIKSEKKQLKIKAINLTKHLPLQ